MTTTPRVNSLPTMGDAGVPQLRQVVLLRRAHRHPFCVFVAPLPA